MSGTGHATPSILPLARRPHPRPVPERALHTPRLSPFSPTRCVRLDKVGLLCESTRVDRGCRFVRCVGGGTRVEVIRSQTLAICPRRYISQCIYRNMTKRGGEESHFFYRKEQGGVRGILPTSLLLESSNSTYYRL